MTTTTRSPDGAGSAVVRPAGTTPAVVPTTRGTGGFARTMGVVLVDAGGARWQRTADTERLVTVVTATAVAVGRGLGALSRKRRAQAGARP